MHRARGSLRALLKDNERDPVEREMLPKIVAFWFASRSGLAAEGVCDLDQACVDAGIGSAYIGV